MDILVRFDASPNWRDYFGAQFYLEDLLQRPVELATRDDVRAEMRPQVEREAVDV